MIFAVIIIAVLIILSIFPLKVTHMLLTPKLRSTGEILEKGLSDGSIDPGLLKLDWQDFSVLTRDNVRINGQLLEGRADSCIIFSHGISGSRASAYRMLSPFVEAGWGIVLYDLRGHGESGGRGPYYGYREKRDLAAVVGFAGKRWPGREINLYGISMGGATVLQYLPEADYINRAVSDSSFSSVADQLYFRMVNAGLPRFIHKPLLIAVAFYTGIIGGFSLFRADPAAAAASSGASGVPLLLVHTEKDDEVPVYMCRKINDARPAGSITVSFVAAEGGHTGAATAACREWTAAVGNFFNIQ